MTDLAFVGLAEAGRLIATRKLSPVEYLDALSARVEEAKRLRQDADVEAVALTNAVRRSLIGGLPEPNWIPLLGRRGARFRG